MRAWLQVTLGPDRPWIKLTLMCSYVRSLSNVVMLEKNGVSTDRFMKSGVKVTPLTPAIGAQIVMLIWAMSAQSK